MQTHDDWRSFLKWKRTARRMTQRQLGDAVHLSSESVRKYENGSRTPHRHILVQMLAVLEASESEATQVLVAAGYAPVGTGELSIPEPSASSVFEDALAEMARTPWPRFAMNSAAEIVALNQSASLLWGGLDALATTSGSRSRPTILTLFVSQPFQRHVVNLDDCLVEIISRLLAPSRGLAGSEAHRRQAEAILADSLHDGSALSARLLRAWEAALATGKRAPVRRLHWREPGAEMRFLIVMAAQRNRAGLIICDFIPGDATSHLLLERALAVRARRQSRGDSADPA